VAADFVFKLIEEVLVLGDFSGSCLDLREDRILRDEEFELIQEARGLESDELRFFVADELEFRIEQATQIIASEAGLPRA